MARPTSFKRSGGFLNNVDGVISGYEFTDEFPGGTKQAKKGDFNPLYFLLKVRVDGADDDIQTTLFAGSADDFEISRDGATLTPVAEGVGLRESSDLAHFMATLLDSGFPAANTELFYSDSPEDAIDFRAIVGTRVRFVQAKDDEATKRLGPRKDKKTGKSYDRQRLEVTKVYALPASRQATAPARAAKGGGKMNGSAKDVSLIALADDVLVAIVQDKGGSMPKAKLPLAVSTAIDKQDPNREELRRLIYTDDYLLAAADRGIITYDQAAKAQTIALA